MPINNALVFTEIRFKAEEFLDNTGNMFSLRPYVSKEIQMRMNSINHYRCTDVTAKLK